MKRQQLFTWEDLEEIAAAVEVAVQLTAGYGRYVRDASRPTWWGGPPRVGHQQQMRSGGTLEEPGVNPLLFGSLAKIATTLLALSKHKMELQEHRAKFKTPKRH